MVQCVCGVNGTVVIYDASYGYYMYGIGGNYMYGEDVLYKENGLEN